MRVWAKVCSRTEQRPAGWFPLQHPERDQPFPRVVRAGTPPAGAAAQPGRPGTAVSAGQPGRRRDQGRLDSERQGRRHTACDQYLRGPGTVAPDPADRLRL